MLAAIPSGVTVAALAGLCVGVAVALHAWVEVPLTAIIRRHTPRACR
jgi:hypothetical protein